MDTLEVLERVQDIAEAVKHARPAQPPAWRLLAREPGGADTRELPLASYRAGRTLAVELSELGLVVTVRDPEHRVRLCVWPPRYD